MESSRPTKRRFVSVPITDEQRKHLEEVAAENDWSLAKVARNLMAEGLKARAEEKAAA